MFVIFGVVPKRLIIRFRKLNFKNITKKKILRKAVLVLAVLTVLTLGILIGAYKAILQNLPSIAELEEFEPNIITYIYADNGEPIGEYAIEKRIEVTYEEIPEVLKQAIIATEDPRFFRHKGIDFLGMLRALKEDVKLILTPRRLHGGSTISQQLARELFLHRKQTLRRKLKEVLLALKIERKYSKEKILTLYCNQFNLGHGAYGVEAAAQLYFGKPAAELNLEEAAMITGIFRGPGVYSPYRNPDRTFGRRNHVINRMIAEGYITEETGEEARRKPMNVLPLYRGTSGFAAYFKEEVRKYLEANYGADALYTQGLRVYTTLNINYQKYAEEALVKQLHVLDKRDGWRGVQTNLLDKGIENLEDLTESVKDPQSGEIYLKNWRGPEVRLGQLIEGVVLSSETATATLKIKGYFGKISNKDIAWTKTKSLKKLIKRGDIILAKVNELDEEKKEVVLSLEQEPILEGAFLSIDPLSGQIKAMVGGYSFDRLKYNQAIQAKRQSGSVIKPLLYTAALENNYTAASIIVDEPTEFEDKWSGDIWAPPNYDSRFKGSVTLRIGLEESRNIVTAKILNYISPQTGVAYCKKFGLTSTIYPYMSLSLGAFEVPLIELVSAFSTFPNKGVRIKPYFMTHIEDKEGNILEEAQVESEEVISPQIAYIMTSLLQGVVQRGTAQAAKHIKKPLGGKTGTTNDFADAWFIGFSPSLCAGVWIGHPEARIPIGDRQSGAVAGLPVWVDFFQRIVEEETRAAEENGEDPVEEEFEVPPNLSFADIDYKTGLLATPFCLFPFREVFIPGTEPNRFCSHEDHMMTLDYYEILKKQAANN
ncbi:MAG: PBP1A family penicillin-binding protein [Candidatus Aminicenantes bacterium]|nr:PBP1A family penicillin-binding protein [Candidatus Aminicenantes bacterium]